MNSTMDRLAQLYTELASEIAKCAKCGMCQGVCPLYGQTQNENDVARGKLALLDALGQNMFDDPSGVLERLNRCLLCGSCAANCANSVNATAVFLKARIILSEYAGLSLLKKLAFKKILAHPSAFEKWTRRGVHVQNWLTRAESATLNTRSLRLFTGLGRRHFPPLANVSFHQMMGATAVDSTVSETTVLFYPGCLINHVFPNVGMAAMHALWHENVRVFIPKIQICCGIPAVAAGDAKTARSLVHQNLMEIKAFSFDHIITACPTCAYTIKKIWPMIAGDTDPDVRALLDLAAARTLDISQFICSRNNLTEQLPSPNPDAALVTYHDPCHLKKSMGVFQEPRALITTNPEYRLKEMKRPDQCCGMGGSFGLEHFDLSDRIGDAKLANILATDCAVAATGCPACMAQLMHVLSRSHSNVLVKHAIEIYAEQVDKNRERVMDEKK